MRSLHSYVMPAFVAKGEPYPDDGDEGGEAEPVAVPVHVGAGHAGVPPPAAALVADEVADAGHHQGKQSLRARSHGGRDAVLQVDLRGHVEEREAHAMHGDAKADRGNGAVRIQSVAQHASGDAAEEEPLEPNAREQPGEGEQADGFRDLREAHQRGGVLDAKFAQVQCGMRVEGGERDIE